MDKQLKILVVDDEPINIDVLTGLLKADYKLMVAKNGERALKAALSGNPDLILLDIMMPDMDGYEVCRRLKADQATQHIPVIFITAMNEVDDETKGFEIGAVDYIVKPISPPILKARVKTQLALVQHQQALQAAYATIKLQKDRMEDELNVGRNIQMSMMPLDFPTASDHKNFSLHAQLVPARELGGDFYDFFFITESVFCFCVGDVSGKGVPAALFMAVAKTLIKSSAGGDVSTARLLTDVNNALCKDNEYCMFVTLFLAICDTRTGHVTYTNAGHNPPFICKGKGHLKSLDSRHGPVAGAMEGVTYRQDTTVLNDGDILLMYTDGVTESMNQECELFSDKRLVSVLKGKEQGNVKSMVASVMSSVRDFENGADQFDDITILAFQYHGVNESMEQGIRENKKWKNLTTTDDAISWFNTFAQRHNLEKSVCRKVNLVFDDLLSNIIFYACQDKEQDQEIEIKLVLSDDKLTITFTDNGVPFDPLARNEPDLLLSVDDRNMGGLGIHLVCKMVDTISYQRIDDKNTLTMSIGTGAM